jgi:hypothetical protein
MSPPPSPRWKRWLQISTHICFQAAKAPAGLLQKVCGTCQNKPKQARNHPIFVLAVCVDPPGQPRAIKGPNPP